MREPVVEARRLASATSSMPKRISAKELGGNPSGRFLMQLADINERCGAIKNGNQWCWCQASESGIIMLHMELA
jgi:hypothetical protein